MPRPTSRTAPHVQDRVDAKCLECAENGVSERGSYLRWLIHRLMEEGKEPGEVGKELSLEIAHGD